MDAHEIIEYIANAKKKTPVKLTISLKEEFDFPGCKVFRLGNGVFLVYGDWEDIKLVLSENADKVLEQVIENDMRNSAVAMLDKKDINARIEPGAIIRDMVHIGEGAVIMMGAVINIGAVIGEKSMIDMGAILGGRAIVGKNCHIGAGAVLAGVIEPPSALPVRVGDDVVIGANAVVIEGVQIGSGAVVAAGAVVIDDVAPGAVVAGVPARVIKMKDDKTFSKTEIVAALRKI